MIDAQFELVKELQRERRREGDEGRLAAVSQRWQRQQHVGADTLVMRIRRVEHAAVGVGHTLRHPASSLQHVRAHR